MVFNHKRADFWLPNFGLKKSLLSLLKHFKRFWLFKSKNACQTHICVMAKLKNIVLTKKTTLNVLPHYACSFGRGITLPYAISIV